MKKKKGLRLACCVMTGCLAVAMSAIQIEEWKRSVEVAPAYAATVMQKNVELPTISSIIYHLDGGENATSNAKSYIEGTSVLLSDPTKLGYTFGGWYTEAEFINQVTEISADSTGTIVLYAKFSKIEITPPNTSEENSTELESSEKADPIDNPENNQENNTKKRGCGSSIVGVGSVIATSVILGGAIYIKRKRD